MMVFAAVCLLSLLEFESFVSQNYDPALKAKRIPSSLPEEKKNVSPAAEKVVACPVVF
jgi:hypothetical protein